MLEELAWVADSPLWAGIARYVDIGIPSSRSLSFTNNLQNFNRNTYHSSSEHYNPERNTYSTNFQGDAPTLVSRFNNSPLKSFERMSVKRRLDYDSYSEVVVDETGTISEDGESSLHGGPRLKRTVSENVNTDFTEYQQQQTRFNPGPFSSSMTVFFRKVI